MDLTITVDSGDPLRDTLSLEEWLLRDQLVRHAVHTTPRPAGVGQMGVSDVLTVALGPAGLGVALASTLAVWLRHRTSDVKVEVTGKGGTVTIDARRAKDTAAVLESVRSIIDGAVSDGGSA